MIKTRKIKTTRTEMWKEWEEGGGTANEKEKNRLAFSGGIRPQSGCMGGDNTAVAAPGDVAIDETNFPDANFRSYLKGLDSGSDGTFTAEEIQEITKIDVAEQGINDLAGVEYFTALDSLNCDDNQYTISVANGIFAIAIPGLERMEKGMVTYDFTGKTAAELAPYNIRVAGYIPGVIDTELTKENQRVNGEKLYDPLAIRRLGTAKEVAQLIAFLASDAASYLCGTCVEVTGGKYAVQNPAKAYELSDAAR